MRVEYRPTAVAKTHALGPVYYEIQQFCKSALLRLDAPSFTPEANAYLESMLVHVRVLTDFFGRATRPTRNGEELDDVLSCDFKFPATPLGLPEDYQTRINKELVHLTYTRATRVTNEEKNWEFVPLVRLVNRCIEFMDSRSKEELDRLVEFRGHHGTVPLSWMNLKQALVALRLWARQQSSTTVSTTSSSSCLEVQEAV